MNMTHETLIVETSGPGAGMLMPGRIQRALSQAAGIRAEDIGTLHPLGRTRVAVEIAMQRALNLMTPMVLPVTEGAQTQVWMLRRDDDPTGDEISQILVTWKDGGECPSPGALAKTISNVSGGMIGPEDLGPAFMGTGWLRLELPLRVVATLSLPGELKLDDGTSRVIGIENGTGGKKNA